MGINNGSTLRWIYAQYHRQRILSLYLCSHSSGINSRHTKEFAQCRAQLLTNHCMLMMELSVLLPRLPQSYMHKKFWDRYPCPIHTPMQSSSLSSPHLPAPYQMITAAALNMTTTQSSTTLSYQSDDDSQTITIQVSWALPYADLFIVTITVEGSTVVDHMTDFQTLTL